MQNKSYDRRDFLKYSGIAAGGAILTGSALSNQASASPNEMPGSDNKTIRLGFIGIGGRGAYHLSCALGIEGVEVPALCEIKDERLYEAKRWVEDSGRPVPRLYNQGPTDFNRLCEEEDLDAVIISTPWKWHAPMCLAAMRNDKHAVSEVPIILTLDEAWEIVETWEKTGKWATIGLEQALFESSDGLSVLNMIQKGLLGDILHVESGYVHDLRLVKFDPQEEPWRLQHSIDRNGNLYPDHPMNKMIPSLDINHGDRIDYLVSMSTKSGMLNKYAALNYGEESHYAKVKMNQGDYNASLIRTVNGKMITLNFDTNTPHPREDYRIQGTKGVYLKHSGESKIYIEGMSPESHQWEPADKYLKEYAHPAITNYNPPARIWGGTRGHGGRTSTTPITWHRLIEDLREDRMPYFDVYDSVTSSAVSPVSEESVANNSKPVEFPDFTKGKWKDRPKLTFL
ncbi:MAG: Gfo/Idh/MocA family oxidoreductase [Bacteroidales bacterium]